MRPLMRYLVQIHQHRHGNLGGRTRVSTEGWNATFTALDLPHASITAAATLQHVAQDLRQFIPVCRLFATRFQTHGSLERGSTLWSTQSVAPSRNWFISVWTKLRHRWRRVGHPRQQPQQFHQYLAGTITGISPVFGWHHHGHFTSIWLAPPRAATTMTKKRS